MDNNEEQMTPEILKGMDEMTNIQNVVKTINYDMINATKVCLDASKQLGGRICHPVSLDKIEPHLGDQVMGELGGEKLVLKEDGSLTTVPNFAQTEFIQEMKPVLEPDPSPTRQLIPDTRCTRAFSVFSKCLRIPL